MASPRSAAIDALDRAIAELRRSNETLTAAMTMMHDAIFGRADVDAALSLPGLQGNVKHIQGQVGKLSEQLEDAAEHLQGVSTKVDRLRWQINGALAIAAIILAIVDVLVRMKVAGLG